MKIRSILLMAVSAVACWSSGVQRADASQVLYDGAGFMQGTQSFSDSFTLSSPGTLTVTLGNVGWPQPLASLQLLMSSASGKLGPEMSATTSTTSTFNVGSGEVFANWFGTAQGSLNAGVYSLEIQFQPNGSSGNPVPLPTSIALLLSGLGLLIWQRRIKAGTDGVLEDAGNQRNARNPTDNARASTERNVRTAADEVPSGGGSAGSGRLALHLYADGPRLQ